MVIKKYSQFINESYINIRQDLVEFFDSNKHDIESKGLNFKELRENFTKSIENLNPNFLQNITDDISQCDLSDKAEFKVKFEKVLHEITEELEKNSVLTEGFFDFIKSIWSEIKKHISDAVHWISDRIFTIAGVLTMSLSGILFIINQWGSGLAMPYEFGNVLINTVLMIGAALFKFGQKNDEYKNISEI